MLMLKVLKACIVRAALLLHITMTVWRVTVDLHDDMYWLIMLATLPFFIEAFYTIIKRRGDDFLLFTPCFFFYLLTTVPCVWLLELRKTDVYMQEKEDILFNKTAEKDTLVGDLDINPNTWTILIEELLLYLLIISRWILPRGEVTREQLSELLFAFIGIASDIMEMFSLFGVEQVRKNRILSYCILSVWSVAVSQFCMTLTVTHKPRRGKNIRMYDDNEPEKKKKATISNEIIAIFLSMVMQDVPFVSVRLYTIITYDLITYSLVFFTSKNCLVICLLFYKVAVLLQKRYCPEKSEDKEDGKSETRLDNIIIGNDFSGASGNGMKQRKLVSSEAGGSSRIGGSVDKKKLQRLYDIENESMTSKGSKKSKKKEKVDKSNKKKTESIASRSTASKSEVASLKQNPSFVDGNASMSSTPKPTRFPNGDANTKKPEGNINEIQPAESLKESASIPSSLGETKPQPAPANTALVETKATAPQNSTPKLQAKQQTVPNPKPSPKQEAQPIASTPKTVSSSGSPTTQAPGKQKNQKPLPQAVNTNAIQQRRLPNPHKKEPYKKIAGGYGWISTRQQEDDVIVDGLS